MAKWPPEGGDVWGLGSFDNRVAVEWMTEVHGLDDVRAPFARLKQVTDDYEGSGEYEVPLDFARQLIAAAEITAMLTGKKIAGFPEDLAARLTGVEPDDLLWHQARNATNFASKHSQLSNWWADYYAGHLNDWNVEIVALDARLSPPPEPRAIDRVHLNQALEKSPDECAFCMKVPDEEQMVAVELSGWRDNRRLFKFLPAMHFDCLAQRLHPRRLFLMQRYDFDNMPDKSLL